MGTGAKVAGVIGAIICAIAAGVIEAFLFGVVHNIVVILAGAIGAGIAVAMFSGEEKKVSDSSRAS